MGYWMYENIDKNERIWSDLAVPIVESKLDYDQFYSSDTLIPKAFRGTEFEITTLTKALDSLQIKYVLSYSAPFDHASKIIPQLDQSQPFEWQGFLLYSSI